MYVSPNFKTKKALREALLKGEHVTVFSPGPFPCIRKGRVTVEGPHSPEVHRWYARVLVNGAVVKKIIS